jgi:NitT/TauT family transport system ATP-binding protein
LAIGTSTTLARDPGVPIRDVSGERESASADGRRDVIRVTHLDKLYATGHGEVHALQDIDFTVKEGEFISIVGPSGCGKSTLLKILAGLLPKTTGEVELDGTPIGGPRKDIGVVFQAPVLFPWRSVLRNVMLPPDVQKLDREFHRRKAMELIEMVGLKGFENRFPWELSGGMQQRVGIIRALIHDPKMLLMDEPFGALDAMTRDAMNLELQRIWMERKKTIIFITHSIPEAVFLGDRVLVMTPRPGRIADDRHIDLPRPRPLDVMTTPAFGEHVRHVRAYFNSHSGIDG